MKRLLTTLLALFAFASISNAQCDATYTYTHISCDSVWFVPVSTGPQYTYYWDFGDGNTSNDPSPTHAYGADGSYVVVLTLVDTVAGCSNSITVPIVVNCCGACSGQVVGAWTWFTDSLGCEATFVSTVNGINPPYTYFWDFGDGNTSTLPNPTHAYSPLGGLECLFDNYRWKWLRYYHVSMDHGRMCTNIL